MKTIAPILSFAALAGLALFAAPANADVITPTIHAPLTTTTAVGGYEIVKTVNSSGLSDPNNTPSNVLDDVNSNGATPVVGSVLSD